MNRQDVAVMALRKAERDLARLADLAILQMLPADDHGSCAEGIRAALANVRAALALIDRAAASRRLGS